MVEPLLVYCSINSKILCRAIEEKSKLKIQWRGSYSKWNTQFERERDIYLLESQEVGTNMNGCALIRLYV